MGSYDDTGLLSVSGLLSVVEASCCACFVLCGPFDGLRDPGCCKGPFDELRDHSGILDVVRDPMTGSGILEKSLLGQLRCFLFAQKPCTHDYRYSACDHEKAQDLSRAYVQQGSVCVKGCACI